MTETGPRGGTGVAILGYGAIADMHVVALRAAGAHIRAVAGPKRDEAQEFAARHGIAEVTTDPEQAIATSGVEAVVIASPSGVHAEQASAALAAGRHVLVEIPLALSLADAESLVAEAGQAGRTLAVCHTLRYWEPFRVARAAMRDDGWKATNVVARALSRRHENVGWTGRRRSWTDDLLWHHGGHVVDAVLAFLDDPVTSVSAEVGPVWERSGLPMDYSIALRSSAGAVAAISLSYHARTGVSDYVVVGEEHALQLLGADVRSPDGPLLEGLSVDAVQTRAVLEQDTDFLECAATGRRPVSDAASVLPVMRVLQAVWDRVTR